MDRCCMGEPQQQDNNDGNCKMDGWMRLFPLFFVVTFPNTCLFVEKMYYLKNSYKNISEAQVTYFLYCKDIDDAFPLFFEVIFVNSR